MPTHFNRDLQKGRIIKGIGGFYYVRLETGEVIECRARGKFRMDGEKPIPGDFVKIAPESETEGASVWEIEPRRNQLIRPMIANVDQLLIVVAEKKPKPDLLLVDKLLLYAIYENIKPVIVVNKGDLAGNTYDDIKRQYKDTMTEVVPVSAATGLGMERLKEIVRGKNSCLAGQSAVGKSSLLNAFEPGLNLKTGGLSRKTDRGKHTTRHSELIELKSLNAMMADTPGFSILECMEIESSNLRNYYPEYNRTGCRFDGCTHIHEPGCVVLSEIEQGLLSKERHERYCEIMKELLERKKTRYD